MEINQGVIFTNMSNCQLNIKKVSFNKLMRNTEEQVESESLLRHQARLAIMNLDLKDYLTEVNMINKFNTQKTI